jgi:hypothetical protein
MFKYESPYMINGQNAKVLDVSGGKDNENANILMYKKHSGLNQQWDVIYADQYEKEPTKGQLNKKFGLYVERPFYVVSKLKSGRYLDLINNRNMVIKTRNGRKTQIWWFDQKSLTIKTKLNNQSWDIQSSGRTNNMQVWSTNSGWFQIFGYEREHFINWTNKKALDVSGGKDAEGQAVITWKEHNGNNQKWNVVYLDEDKGDQTKGLNKDFGFHCSRPFYIVSRLPMHRVVQSHGANNVALNRYVKGRNYQQWFFNCKDKTIRSNHWKNYAMEIQSNGGSSNLRTTSTINSRWW